ncbi:phospho-N-acetylmuramoyl-pentapeptide-transferase [Thermosulfurimonas sp. F29]|uniref:phospho-N-acetylmuramoyl-pentapeptide- transferase n=1 Tax=Thermosulfurimonas sp. F29 TaxID=2867247 RepID=UPI001C83FB96|nr:phospho-N-acetylmuramoyl-pentapeptide-transferase [Thermosulfurimonas sp. F29]MBX6422078.1 phospho-N-acetylmuramoyl-pentapeptide-transferase [Thermosulfurimonas sp. F29]
MLYHLLYPLHEWLGPLNVFRYITFRALYATVTAGLFVFLFMPFFIEYMRRRRLGQVIREEGPETHRDKAGTPTMGGVVMLAAVTLSVLLWGNLTNPYLWLALGTLLSFGALGLADDYLKLSRGRNLGLRAREKLLVQGVLVVLLWLALFRGLGLEPRLTFPFFKNFRPELGWFYLPFIYLVVVGTSNAMNLTDGLDGLAIVPFMVVAGVYALLAYVAGHVKFAHYLQVPYVPGAGELAVFCGALLGAGLGFLWYNAHPAEVFMGDVGSLSLGAALGAVAVMVRQELLLVVAGGLFVAEALSVMLQVGYFKLTGGRRLFRMAPLHHHFELSGWPENKVVVRFWIVSVVCGLLALSTLKLR